MKGVTSEQSFTKPCSVDYLDHRTLERLQCATWIIRLQYGSKLYTLFILCGHYGEVQNPWTQEVYASHRLGTYELVPALSLLLTQGSEPPHQVCIRVERRKKHEHRSSQ